MFEAWAPVILYTGLIFTLSSIPDLSVPGDFKMSDKIMHVTEYMVWGLLLRRALDRAMTGSAVVKAFSTIVVGAALCYVDESFQKTVGRNYSYYDMAADVLGVSLAQLAYLLIRRRLLPGERADA
jgi:VanZ family protein